MNTNTLKKFAQQARKKLMQQVAAKLDYALTADTPELREKTSQIKKLKEAINNSSKEQVVDKVAYTWFNRFVALRFLDANDYQPLSVRVISPLPNQTAIEILSLAKQGDIPSELKVSSSTVMDLLDGRIPSSNPENEAYKELLIASCNHLNHVLPFLFERINDYTELLLPDDLTSEFSILSDVVKGMTEEDCQEVEIIGWLYQFYISEKKDEVFAAKSKVKKEDIPAATQLFTPRWIVEYMVQNTVGKLWLQNNPNSKLREHMPYFIESPSMEANDFLMVSSPEEITLLDQACGSGHILVYGFELLSKIYEEEGYNQSEIANLIITKNLFGFEIDERAAQLAGMAVLMKARAYHRRLFKAGNIPEPNILCYQDLLISPDEAKSTLIHASIEPSEELLHDLNNMREATNLGSLIAPHATLNEIEKTQQKLNKTKTGGDAFLQYNISQLTTALNQLQLLAKKYHCVVDNPPYMGGGSMNAELAKYVKTNYADSKADLMACFMEAGLKVLRPKGFLGMINQHSWMFLSSYEALRKKLIDSTAFDTLLHLGSRTFPEIGGEVVQNAAFTFCNSTTKGNSVYFRLVDYNRTELKRQKTLEATQNPNCDWLYTANQKDFEKVPGNPIGYWISEIFKKIFDKEITITNVGNAVKGLDTGRDEQYLKFWSELPISKTQLKDSYNAKWFFYKKGGAFRKWFGNYDYMVNWEDNGFELRNFRNEKGKIKSRPQNIKFYFKSGLEWSRIASSKLSLRIIENSIFGGASSALFLNENSLLHYTLGYINSKVVEESLKILNPTLVFQVGDLKRCPIKIDKKDIVERVVEDCISISEMEWNTRETSWDFNKQELIRLKSQNDLNESYDLYENYWRNKFFQLHKNEEELNRQFIEIYGLQEELAPDVPLKEITILKEETSIENGQLVFHADEVFEQFVSYAVGCMFGRYSLDKEGLVLANQGETLEDYFTRIERNQNQVSFLPDDDNIIPVLEDEWFEDDIVGRFHAFLKASFGAENFRKNLAFVEESLGKDVRKYFTKDFYNDHIRRYKKRPIYWMFSSPKGSFNVLVYMHRYTPDTIHNILNNYLREFIEKLKSSREHQQQIQISGSAVEQNKATKEIDKIDKMMLDCQEYEREILYPLATERIPIDLDDGVLVNYNKFGKAVKEVKGLNDAKAKKKVQGFDWIDTSQIR